MERLVCGGFGLGICVIQLRTQAVQDKPPHPISSSKQPAQDSDGLAQSIHRIWTVHACISTVLLTEYRQQAWHLGAVAQQQAAARHGNVETFSMQ